MARPAMSAGLPGDRSLSGRSLDPASNDGTRGMVAAPILSGNKTRLTGLLAHPFP